MNEVSALYLSLFFIVVLFVNRYLLYSKVEIILASIFSMLAIITLSVIAESAIFIIIGLILTISNIAYSYYERDLHEQ